MQRISWLKRLLLIAAVLAFVVAGLSRISFNVDILKLLPANLRQVEGLGLFLKHFSLPQELIVTVEASDSDTAEAAADALAERFRAEPGLVKRAVSRPPWEKNAADIAEFLAYLVLNQPPEKVRELVARLDPANTNATLDATLEALNDSVSPREVAMRGYDPYGITQTLDLGAMLGGESQSEFSSADGAFHIVYVEAPAPFRNYQDAIAWITRIKDVARAWNTPVKVTLGFTGEPGFVADISGSMHWDMQSSGIATLVIIGVIFWLGYRRTAPLLYLLGMLLIVFFISLAAAGFFLHQLTVIGVGFASIMIGLSVDYGYFVFHKSLRHDGSVRALQWQCFQNVIWTAGTTASAFFALNLSSLPGLSQLGNLVGIGVIVGSCVMLGIFAPIASRFKKKPAATSLVERLFASPRFTKSGAWVTLALVAVLAAALAIKGLPSIDATSRSLRPRVSDAYAALDRLYQRLTDDREMLSLVVSGSSEDQVLARLRLADARLADARQRGDAIGFRSVLPLWPDATHQRENLAILATLAPEAARLKQAAFDHGFTDESFALTGAVLEQWGQWAATSALPIWPANEASRWIFRRTAIHTDGKFLALGMVRPASGREDALAATIPGEGIYLTSWNLLGHELQHTIPREFQRIITGLIGIILVLLWFAFRSLRDVALFVVTTILVFIALAGAMSLLGMEWNFFNLAAILLLLGTGTDYSILLLLRLQRNGGDIAEAHRDLGIVVCLCAFSAAAGFGSIAWANNIGLASLGKTCALGLVLDALISVFLLPRAWAWCHRGSVKQ